MTRFSFTCFVMFAAVAGCETMSSVNAPTTLPAEGRAVTAASSSHQVHAECVVCKMNYDLACIDVTVDPKTPTCVYQGKTYYFCSDDCRDKFAKDPEKYLKR